MEQGQAIRKAEAKRASLESQNKAFKSEIGDLKRQLQLAKDEIKRLRAEKDESEKEEAELPEIQFQILKRLPSEHGGIAWTLGEIAYMARIPIDETEIHISRLSSFGLIQRTWSHSEHVWHRTIAGNEVVFAQRFAGQEEEAKPRRYKYADLRKDAQEMLLLIARSEEGIKEFELTARCAHSDAYLHLAALRNESLINSSSGGGIYSDRKLILARKGAEYLEERGLI